MKKFIVWGCGKHTKDLFKKYVVPVKHIEAIIDSKPELYGESYIGIQICGPDSFEHMSSSIVAIGTKTYFDEVKDTISAYHTDKLVVSLDDLLEQYPERNDVTTVEYEEKISLDEQEKRIEEAGKISQDALLSANVLSSRYEAIKRMPKNMVVAEVGVAYGDFSEFMLKTMEPKHFYAIDYFNKDNPFISFWGRDDFKKEGLTHEEWYRRRFKNEIANDRMTVCSGLSWECLEEFEDDFFDFIYLDACHDYESVKKDTWAAYKKIKNNGYIQFNDYTLYDIYQKSFYGVIPVVNEFIAKTNSKLIYYCLDTKRFDDVVIQISKTV